jgi:hypothetical protein
MCNRPPGEPLSVSVPESRTLCTYLQSNRASGGTALEAQKGALKKATTVDKSKPVVKGEHDKDAEKVL